jgi:hypothetical protein
MKQGIRSGLTRWEGQINRYMKLVGWHPTGMNYPGVESMVELGNGRQFSEDQDELKIYLLCAIIIKCRWNNVILHSGQYSDGKGPKTRISI